MSDVSLTFDNKMFLKALDEVSQKMDSISKGSMKSAEKLSKGASISAMSFLKVNAVLGLVKSGISKIAANIPELGKTFSIAGDIITRNLLWPLRKQLVPYLQKFLNWVRDHRAMFVRWGAALANVFQVIVQGVKAAINIIKPFIDMIMKFVNKLFGGLGTSFDKTINMIIFKIAAVGVFLEAFLAPIIQKVTDAIYAMLNGMAEFFSGFASKLDFSGIFDSIVEITGAIKDLIATLFGGEDTMRSFGEIVGTVFQGVIDIVKVFLKLIEVSIKSITFLAKGIKTLMSIGTKDYEKNKADFIKYGKTPAIGNASAAITPVPAGASGSKSSTMTNSGNINIDKIEIKANTEEQAKELMSGATKGLHQQVKKEVLKNQAQKGM